MPESMFGYPSQHLLPSHPPASAGASDPHTAPLQHPPTFKDFRFNSIGKQPELLSRISLPQPDHTEYHSSTPSPTPTFANDGAFQSKSYSRPTLLQQLAGSDFSSMRGDSRWNAQTSQSNGSLASRINMDNSPSIDIANTAHGTASRSPSPPLRVTTRRATGDASLIPPVEFLTQPPDSSPATPASWAPPLELMDVHSPVSSTPLFNTTAITTSPIPTPPTVTTNIASEERMEPSPPFAVVDAMMQPSPSEATAIDSLVARQERLQSIIARLANLAAPAPPPSSQSPPPDPSSVTPNQSSQSRHTPAPILLCHPCSVNQSSDPAGLSTNDTPMHTGDSSLPLVPSPTTLIQERQAQHRTVIESFENLKSAINAFQRAQIDNENTFALRLREFDEQRAAFEQTKRAEEVMLKQELQELQQKRKELNAKEASLASLEKESKAREEARKGVLAKRQAQEEEKRAAESKRVQAVQEQMENAMNELKEIEALKAKCQIEQLASEGVPDDLPTVFQEGMDEEETAVVKSRNDLLCAIKHLRRMHTDKVQKLEESNRTLRRLEEDRKKRVAKEAERRRIMEEDRLRGHAEIERAHDDKRRQFEAEKKRQEVENDREQARPSVGQQAHIAAQARDSGRTEAASGQIFKHPSPLEEVSASQQLSITNTTRIRTAREDNFLPQETSHTLNVDKDGTLSTPHRTVPLSDISTSSGGSQSTTPQSKQQKKKRDKPISGGVMLAAASLEASGGHLPPKLSSLSSSDHVVENTLNSATTSAVPVSAEGGHKSSLPAQLASGVNRVVNTDIRATPDQRRTFSRTPKSQTVLDATTGGGQELNIGPVTGVSPTQQNVNLRHLKRLRGRVEGNDSGDRSVRTISVKSEEDSSLFPKREEHDGQSRELVQASLSTSLPPRPAVIPPPRPQMFRKHHEASASQTDWLSSYPPESKASSLPRREADDILDEQPRETLPPDTPSSRAMNVPGQLPVPTETTSSLLLRPAYPEPQTTGFHINAGERPNQDRGEIYDTTSSEPASAILSRELDGEDPSRSNRRFPDEHRRTRDANGSRRMSDHHSPPFVTSRSTVTSPTQSHRLIDSWHPQNPSNRPRAEPMRATSPTTGKKRPSESNDNDHGHRARRQRGDVWIAQDHHRDADSHRSHWDRPVDFEPDERHAGYRTPLSPADPILSYPPDLPRATYDNRTYVPPLSEEPTTLVARREQFYRRTENDDNYQRYQPSVPGYNAITDQHHTSGARVGRTYEPMGEERMDAQPDPSLLARIHDTPSFPPRARGKGEPSRARGDFGRGRGRGVARSSGPPLIDRLTAGPSSLGDRLT
ncbi:hypothetical protein HD554DRAFT_2078982 [Boletus coccyginus]|nr:hypothetical protein HD554DRAFT_2078982 [Boletus coccyginus]